MLRNLISHMDTPSQFGLVTEGLRYDSGSDESIRALSGVA